MPKLADCLRVLRNLLLSPTVSDRLEQSDQRRWRSQYHPLLDSELDQRRVLLERRAEKRFAGQEQNHELRRAVELFPITLCPELHQVSSHLARVVPELRTPGCFIGRLERIVISGDRRLRVDDDQSLIGKPHDHIGAQSAVFAFKRRLLAEIAVTHHARKLDDSSKLHFTPTSTHVGSSQRAYELGSLALEL